MTPPRRAAVCGSPVAHSLSPVLHTAGFAAAGLSGWSYGALECPRGGLAALVAGLGPEWAGLSVTMPLKEEALALAADRSPVAAAVGAANTLVRRPGGGWSADNTDVPGMVRVLRDARVGPAPRVCVLGAGGTARAALAAAAQLGAAEVAVAARRPAAVAQLDGVAAGVGVALRPVPWPGAAAACATDVVISTVPRGAADALAGAVAWAPGAVLFDAVYDPWPTPLAAAAAAGGATVVSGLDLLLAQALGQFERFTGVRPAPEAAMRTALAAAAAARPPAAPTPG